MYGENSPVPDYVRALFQEHHPVVQEFDEEFRRYVAACLIVNIWIIKVKDDS